MIDGITIKELDTAIKVVKFFSCEIEGTYPEEDLNIYLSLNEVEDYLRNIRNRIGVTL